MKGSCNIHILPEREGILNNKGDAPVLERG